MGSFDLVIIVPARCGSKRVRLKNIRPLLGKPLLLYTLEAGKKANVTNEIIVSTDCEDISTVAREGGARVIERPEWLATDEASTEAVLLHALDVLELEGQKPEWVMTLPPTSPLRSAEIIRRAVEIVTASPEAQDCLLTVHENRGDFWRGDPTKKIQRLFPDAPRQQQKRIPLWEENSALYLTRVQALKETNSILGNRVRGLPIESSEGLDINTHLDFLIAEAILKYM